MNLYIFEDNSVVQTMKYGSDVQPWNVNFTLREIELSIGKHYPSMFTMVLYRSKNDLLHVLPSKNCVYLVMSYCGCALDTLPGVLIH